MSADWYLMDNPPIYNGGFEGDEHFAYAQQGFQEMLDTTALCDFVEFITSDFSVITPGQAIVQNVTGDSEDNSLVRQILVPIGTLKDYSYVRFDDIVWIIATQPSNNKFYEKAVLKPCLNQLRWQDPTTKEVFSYWYWCEDMTRYGAGIYSGNLVVKFDSQFQCLLPMDSHTRKLHDGMRFMLELSDGVPLVFKLNRYEGLTGNFKDIKLLRVNLTQTVYDEDRDNIDLMIADYYVNNSVSHNVNCKIEYESDEIKLASFGKFSAVFTDENEQPIDQDFTWEITDNNFDIDKIRISFSDNTIKIIVTNDKSLIGEKFTLNVKVDEVIYATLEIKIIALW